MSPKKHMSFLLSILWNETLAQCYSIQGNGALEVSTSDFDISLHCFFSFLKLWTMFKAFIKDLLQYYFCCLCSVFLVMRHVGSSSWPGVKHTCCARGSLNYCTTRESLSHCGMNDSLLLLLVWFFVLTTPTPDGGNNRYQVWGVLFSS